MAQREAQKESLRVDFVIIGAQKSGTTSLASQLAQHPEICFSKTKEPEYFNRVFEWHSRLSSYHAMFDPVNGQILGEASTMYTALPEWQDTHVRLFAYHPEIKLIYIMRDPVERTISNYAHDFVRGIVKENIDQAILHRPYYVNRSRYAFQIRPYLDLFGSDQILLLAFEEYIADPQTTLSRVAEFLNLPAVGFEDIDLNNEHKTVGNWYLKYSWVRKVAETELFQEIRPHIPVQIRRPIRNALSNRLSAKPMISERTRINLASRLRGDVQAMESIMGRKLDCWATR
jgi:hypothetical protein